MTGSERVETDRAVPKYYLVKMEILKLIEGAEPGTPIPTERALAESLGFARATIRQATTELTAEGRLVRIQGKGTFVAPEKLTVVRAHESFAKEAARQGLNLTTRIVSLGDVPADTVTATALDCAPGTTVHRLERVRYIDGEPLIREVAFLPGHLEDLEEHLRVMGSLYYTLSVAYGIAIVECEDVIETMPAGPEQSALLDVDMGSPLMVILRRSWDAEGTIAEYTNTQYRGDRFRFISRSKA